MIRSLARRGLRKGLVEGSRPWLVVGIVASGVVVLRRLSDQPPERVWTEPLAPGDRVVVRVLPGSEDG